MIFRNNFLILTYHRIADIQNCEANRKVPFYDIAFSVFSQQLDLIKSLRLGSKINSGVLLQGQIKLMLTFDDGTEDHIEIARLLKDCQIPAVFFVSSGKLGWPGYLSREEVLEISRMGHYIGSHTVTHPILTSLSEPEMQKEIAGSKEQLEEIIGQKILWFAPPGGIYNEAVIHFTQEASYKYFRTLDWGYNNNSTEFVLKSFSIYSRLSRPGFKRILAGQGSDTIYRFKETLKKLIGNRYYVYLRKRFYE